MPSWAHFGDLHARHKGHWQSLDDFSDLIAGPNKNGERW